MNHSALSVHAQRGIRARRGQTTTEFAMVIPFVILTFISLFEVCMLMFGVGTARYAVGEGAKRDAELGTAANADTQAVSTIASTAIGQNTFVVVDEIDIYHLLEGGTGVLTVDSSGCGGLPGCYNKYKLDGTPIGSVRWSPASRNVTLSGSDFLGVTIKFHYTWKSGLLAAAPSLNMTSTYYLRLEPQRY